MNKPDAHRLSRHMREIYAPLRSQMSLLDRFRTIWRPFYAPIGEIFPFIEPGTSIFEIGCGMGPVIFSIAGYHTISRYLGVDKDPRVVSIASKANRFANFSFEAGTLFDIPTTRLQEYKTILCFDVLHHIPNDKKPDFLRYLFHGAGADTVVVIKDFDIRPRMGNMANSLTDLFSTRSLVSYMRSQELVRLLRDSGFSILKVEKRIMWVWSHLIVAARKKGA